jgi:hypothetical protein
MCGCAGQKVLMPNGLTIARQQRRAQREGPSSPPASWHCRTSAMAGSSPIQDGDSGALQPRHGHGSRCRQSLRDQGDQLRTIAAPDSVLFLWATVPVLMQAGEVIEALGPPSRPGRRSGTATTPSSAIASAISATPGRPPHDAPGKQATAERKGLRTGVWGTVGGAPSAKQAIAIVNGGCIATRGL